MPNSLPVRVQETMYQNKNQSWQKCNFQQLIICYNLENQNLKMYMHTLLSVLGEIYF